MEAARPRALFEDEHTDARMRRTIPQFAVLGAVAVAATAPFAVPTVAGRVVVLGLATAAASSAAGLRFRNIIGRITRVGLLGLLLGYCVLISVAVAASEDAATPYRAVYLVPVLFTAVFFTGPVRYLLALVAPVMGHVIAGPFVSLEIETTAVMVVMFLFVAHFGAVVSDTLRESLRSTRALHTVLEAASGAPLRDDLAAIGLDAALQVVGWSSGAVLLADGDELRVAAFRATEARLIAVEPYLASPVRLSDTTSTSVAVFTSRRPSFIADLSTLRNGDHPLVAVGIRGLVVLPLVHGDRSLGVLLIADTSPLALDDMVSSRLDRIASQLALALGSASAYREETEVSARLRELNRRKDEFLANVSHELRTPAAAIQLVASTLRASGERLTDEQLAGMYATLERRSEHLSELIENLLEEAAAEAGMMRLSVTSIDWRDAVVRWAEIAQLQSGRVISLHVPAGAILGSGDSVKLERVVANLLSNAAKFSERDTPIDLELRADGDIVELSVEDRGIGIEPADAERIFDRFHQIEGGTTRSAGGFGIGLSLARHFVEAHGGTITLSSAPGLGSRFTVRVPREQAKHAEASPRTRVADVHGLSG
jgi:signal transduction histidine kinase